jgi:TRAP-type mannitol/chloroaromatic compound transport system permease small subunit
VGVNLSTNALNELQWYLFSVIFLLGAAWGLRHDVHVRVDVLYGRLSTRKKAWIDLLGTVLFLIPFCVMMVWVSWPPVARSFAIREVSPDPGGLPRWPIKALLIVSFLLLLLQGLALIVRQIDAIRSGGAPAEPPPHAPRVGPQPGEPDVRHGAGT